ncbi:PEP-CTERM sorting domain-containing protein [Nostoc flagelliforme FACHB-838]|uniref:PEP-CTERM sorting domain-containing protein n=1 Tax=Nostoc flagelliforme FACHB-838 TaxID=2692904 RepID=A0ABR8DRP0_9NOSO|nr:PEP-CTERM sorting domain-containing protein [Nostoc flagelliforme]MBD2531798.1 PEP-CTERM sorting domain-containing protein [Nostoc flagelliforme FACHB-838]
MNQVRSPKVRVALIGLVVASVFHATPVLGAILTRQEFSGDFALVDATSPLLQSLLPEGSEYSGFVVYSEDGTLSDWEMNVNELNLNLNLGATLDVNSGPNVNFELSSGSNWNLVVDFGIAFDAPRYTLERTSGSEITLTGQVGRAGVYIYNDPGANITLSSSNRSIPEPASLLGLLFGLGGIAVSRKASGTKA